MSFVFLTFLFPWGMHFVEKSHYYSRRHYPGFSTHSTSGNCLLESLGQKQLHLMASNWLWYWKVWNKVVQVTGQAAWHKLPKTPNFPMGKDQKNLVRDSILILHYEIKTFPFSIPLLTMALSAFASTSSLYRDNVTPCQFFAAYKLPDTIISDNRSTFISVKLW